MGYSRIVSHTTNASSPSLSPIVIVETSPFSTNRSTHTYGIFLPFVARVLMIRPAVLSVVLFHTQTTTVVVWSLGALLGSGLGGVLAQPATTYPFIFSESGVFGRCEHTSGRLDFQSVFPCFMGWDTTLTAEKYPLGPSEAPFFCAACSVLRL